MQLVWTFPFCFLQCVIDMGLGICFLSVLGKTAGEVLAVGSVYLLLRPLSAHCQLHRHTQRLLQPVMSGSSSKHPVLRPVSYKEDAVGPGNDAKKQKHDHSATPWKVVL